MFVKEEFFCPDSRRFYKLRKNLEPNYANKFPNYWLEFINSFIKIEVVIAIAIDLDNDFDWSYSLEYDSTSANFFRHDLTIHKQIVQNPFA